MVTDDSESRGLSRSRVRKGLRRAAKHLKKGERDQARDDLRATLDLFPTSLEMFDRSSLDLILQGADVASALDGSVKIANLLRSHLKQGAEDPEAYGALIRTLVAAEKNEEALDVCDEGLSRLPGDDSLPLLKADVLRRLGREDEARMVLWSAAEGGKVWREALSALRELQGNPSRIAAVRGTRLEDEGDSHGALASYQEALDEDPRCADALEGRASIFIAEGDDLAAYAALEESLTIESTRASVWEMKARVEARRGETDEAVRSLQVAVRYDPTGLDAVTFLGSLLHQAGRDEEAVEYYKAASETAGDDVAYLEGWREALATLGAWEDHRAVIRRLAEADPHRPELRVDEAWGWFETGQPARAREILAEVLVEAPDGPALRKVGDLALRMEAWDLAREAAEGTLRLHPDDRGGIRCLALALRGLDRNAEALKVLSHGIRLYGDLEFLQLKREILRGQGDTKALFRCCDAILRLTPEAVDVYLEMADLAAAQGRWRRALRVCERGLKAVPGSKDLRLKKAGLLHLDGRPDEAYRVYDTVLRMDEENGPAWKGRGLALFALKDFQGSADAFARSASLTEDPESWYYLGLCYQSTEQVEEALRAFEKAVADGGEAAWWEAQGACLQDTARFREALHAYEQALEADASLDRAILGKAECLLELEDPRAALRVLEGASLDSASHRHFLLSKIRCFELLGDFQGALEAAVALTANDPREGDGWMLRARFARSLGLTTESRLSWSEASKRIPRDPAPKVAEAALLLELGDAQEALRLSDEALALDPRNERAAVARGHTLAALGNHEAALRAFEAALALQPGMEEAVRGKAASLAQRGEFEEALREVGKMEAQDPPDVDIYVLKARILSEAGQGEEALRSLNQALYYGGGSAQVLAAKGRVLGQLGRVEEGTKLLQSAASEERSDPDLVNALAGLLIQGGRFGEALELLPASPRVDASGREASLLRAEALGGLARWDESWEVLAATSRAGPLPSPMWMRLSALYEQQDNGEGAIACYDRALATDGRNLELWKGRGRLYAQQRRWPEALESYQGAQEVAPEDEEVLCGLGRAYLEVDLFDEGREAYGRALAVNPASGTATQGRDEVESRRHARRVEGFALRILQFELTHGRPATKEEAFRYCDVPMELLPDALGYVNEPSPLDILSLDEGEIRTLEMLSRDVLVGTEGTGLPRLAEVVQDFPEMPPSEARRVLEYIQGVVETDLPQEETPGLERLMKMAMELPDQHRETLVLARELGVGAHQAKMVELALRHFGEAPSEGSTGTGRVARAGGSSDRCRKHGTEGIYQHLCGQYLCSACIVGGRCPICRHPVSASLSQTTRPSENETREP
ncbi:MAG: tetratricopeptide repeat protein [Thermoplasmata archaeon]